MSRQVSTGKESQEHPLDNYFRELLARRRVSETAGAATSASAGAVLVHELDRKALLSSTVLVSSPGEGSSSPVVAGSPDTETSYLPQTSDFCTVRGSGSAAPSAELATTADGEQPCDGSRACDSSLAAPSAELATVAGDEQPCDSSRACDSPLAAAPAALATTPGGERCGAVTRACGSPLGSEGARAFKTL